MTATKAPLALLRLPDYNTLATWQVRGLACVWGGEDLANMRSVDLGKHAIHRTGTRASWSPRACYGCTARGAYRALLDHSVQCPLCASEETAPQCLIGQGLSRLYRECRR
ncbi:hypothetical protein ACPCBC_04765 [Streptomyces incarnatus]|nr:MULTISPECIES: hypothetical protein [Streptomyces]